MLFMIVIFKNSTKNVTTWKKQSITSALQWSSRIRSLWKSSSQKKAETINNQNHSEISQMQSILYVMPPPAPALDNTYIISKSQEDYDTR